MHLLSEDLLKVPAEKALQLLRQRPGSMAMWESCVTDAALFRAVEHVAVPPDAASELVDLLSSQ